jgi:hypothetical protein
LEEALDLSSDRILNYDEYLIPFVVHTLNVVKVQFPHYNINSFCCTVITWLPTVRTKTVIEKGKTLPHIKCDCHIINISLWKPRRPYDLRSVQG